MEIKAFHQLILEVKDLEKKFISFSDTSVILPMSSASPVSQALHQVIHVMSPDQQSTNQWVI